MKKPVWLNRGFPFRLVIFIVSILALLLGTIILIIGHKINGVGHLLAGEFYSAKGCLFELRCGVNVKDGF